MLYDKFLRPHTRTIKKILKWIGIAVAAYISFVIFMITLGYILQETGYVERNTPYYTERGSEVKEYRINQKIEIPEKVVSMSSGTSETVFAITESGKVYGWGNNLYSQLGPVYPFIVRTPTLIPGLDHIVQVSSSAEFTLFLSEDGKVYGCGQNEAHQLTGDEFLYDEAREISGLPGDIVRVAATRNSSAALDKNGCVYTWGSNDSLQLGYEGVRVGEEPKKLELDAKFTEISGGDSHMLLLDDQNFVWGFGMNWDGELGASKVENYLPFKSRQKAKQITTYDDCSAICSMNDKFYYAGSAWFHPYQHGYVTGTYKFEKVALSNARKIKSMKVYHQMAVLERSGGDLLFAGFSRVPGSLVDRTQPVMDKSILKRIPPTVIAKEEEFVDYFVNIDGVYIINASGELYQIWNNVVQ